MQSQNQNQFFIESMLFDTVLFWCYNVATSKPQGDHVKEVIIRARVDENLKKAFDLACKNMDITASQALRKFMRDYAKKHAQTDLFKGG